MLTTILIILGTIVGIVICLWLWVYFTFTGWPLSNWLSNRRYSARRNEYKKRQAAIQEQERIRAKYEKADKQ